MASCAVNIPNMLLAVRAGELPGKFNEGRTAFCFPTLSYSSARGATQLWAVSVRLLSGGAPVPIEDEMLDTPAADLGDCIGEIRVESGQLEGKTRDIVPTYVNAGKNLGKKNATNALTQALRDALGRYNKQKKKTGFAVGPPAAAPPAKAAAKPGASKAEAPLMPPPMIAAKPDASKAAVLTPGDFAEGVTLQRKLDGVHFVVAPASGAEEKGAVFAYSRSGRAYSVPPYLRAELGAFLEAPPAIHPGELGVPEDADEVVLEAYAAPRPYLAGELYLHGLSLNQISGQARRSAGGKTAGKAGKAGEAELEYHIFDVFFPYAKAAGHDMASRDRQAYLDRLFARSPRPRLRRVENYHARDAADLQQRVNAFLGEGYEGGIARRDAAGYRYSTNNYHSTNLIKVKPKHDSEFPVVGFTQGARGKDVGALIWECRVVDPVVKGDDRFTVVPKDMTYEERRALFVALGELVPNAAGDGQVTRFARHLEGLPLTVEYAGISTKTGKPLQAKAKVFRTYESGPDLDPVRRLLDECRRAPKS